MSDDLPILEYRAVRNLYRSTHTHIEALVRAKMQLKRVVPPLVANERVPHEGHHLESAWATASPSRCSTDP